MTTPLTPQEWQHLEELQAAVRFWIWRRAKPPIVRYEDFLEEFDI